MSWGKRSKNKQKKASTISYKIIGWLGSFLFVSLIGYMVYFQIFQSDKIKSSKYNNRLEEAAKKVVRGPILARDHQILAETVQETDGAEHRVYPFGELFAHPVGYATYGGSGLESAEGPELLSSHSDLLTRFQNELNEEKKKGDAVVTTLDVELQQTAKEALGSYPGAVLVMDAHTGDLLCDFSAPAFDPNRISEDWEALTARTDAVFLNRAMQGLYPPGSTFKLITALAYLRDHGSFDDFSYTCTGSETFEDFSIHCANGSVHGQENFADALANSCNSAFAHMALQDIHRDTLRSCAESFGFNKKIKDLLLPSEESIFTMEQSTPGQLVMQTAIGQGDTRATPLQMCMVAQAIANDGLMLRPNLIQGIESSEGKPVSGSKRDNGTQVLSEEEASALAGLMREVVTRGTGARQLGDLPYDLAGKTGTAEYSDEMGAREHSWFVGFSRQSGRDIVVCALVEDGGSDHTGASVARALFTNWFSRGQ